MKYKLRRTGKRSLSIILAILMMISTLIVGTISTANATSNNFSQGTTLFFDASSVQSWASNNVIIGAIFYYQNNDEWCIETNNDNYSDGKISNKTAFSNSSVYKTCTKVADNIYSVNVTSDVAGSVRFLRIEQANGGKNIWNYSKRMSVDDMGTNNCVKISDWDNTGKWTTYVDPAFKPGETIYMTGNYNGDWKKGDERYAAYFISDSGAVWVDMKYDSRSGYYKTTVPNDYSRYPKLIFVRMNGSTNENKWDNKWDQTVDLTRSDASHNLFTISGRNSENPAKYTGTWSEYTPTTYTVDVTAGTGGTITSDTSFTNLEYGSGGTISAKANNGYTFNNWTSQDGNVTFTNANSSNTSFTTTGDDTITANFTETMHTVTIVGGTANSTEAGISTSGIATVQVPEGKKFVGWEIPTSNFEITQGTAGGNANDTPTIKFNATADGLTVKAKFEVEDMYLVGLVNNYEINETYKMTENNGVYTITTYITNGKYIYFSNFDKTKLYINTNTNTGTKAIDVYDAHEYSVKSGKTEDDSYYSFHFMDSDGTYTITLDLTTMKFSIAKKIFKVNVSASEGGYVTPSGDVDSGSTIKATANEGYEFDKWVVTDNCSVEDVNSAETVVNATGEGGKVTAQFVKAYKVDYSAEENGSITCQKGTTTIRTGSMVKVNTDVNFKITPDVGYEVKTFTVNGVDKKSALSNNTDNTGKIYSHTVTGYTNVKVTFQKKNYTVKVADGISGGEVKVGISGSAVTANQITATMGDTITITATPNMGYFLKSITVSNVDTLAGNSFTMPASNVTVSATFITYRITGSITTAGTWNDFNNGISFDTEVEDGVYSKDITLTSTALQQNKNKFRLIDSSNVVYRPSDDDSTADDGNGNNGYLITNKNSKSNSYTTTTGGNENNYFYFDKTGVYTLYIKYVDNGNPKIWVVRDKYDLSSTETNCKVKFYSDANLNNEITQSSAETTVYVKVTPNNNYEVKTVTADNVTPDPVPDKENVYSFIMPRADVNVTATAETIKYTIRFDFNDCHVTNYLTYTLEGETKVNKKVLSGPITVDKDSTVTFTVAMSDGYLPIENNNCWSGANNATISEDRLIYSFNATSDNKDVLIVFKSYLPAVLSPESQNIMIGSNGKIKIAKTDTKTTYQLQYKKVTATEYSDVPDTVVLNSNNEYITQSLEYGKYMFKVKCRIDDYQYESNVVAVNAVLGTVVLNYSYKEYNKDNGLSYDPYIDNNLNKDATNYTITLEDYDVSKALSDSELVYKQNAPNINSNYYNYKLKTDKLTVTSNLTDVSGGGANCTITGPEMEPSARKYKVSINGVQENEFTSYYQQKTFLLNADDYCDAGPSGFVWYNVDSEGKETVVSTSQYYKLRVARNTNLKVMALDSEITTPTTTINEPVYNEYTTADNAVKVQMNMLVENYLPEDAVKSKTGVVYCAFNPDDDIPDFNKTDLANLIATSTTLAGAAANKTVTVGQLNGKDIKGYYTANDNVNGKFIFGPIANIKSIKTYVVYSYLTYVQDGVATTIVSNPVRASIELYKNSIPTTT